MCPFSPIVNVLSFGFVMCLCTVWQIVRKRVHAATMVVSNISKTLMLQTNLHCCFFKPWFLHICMFYENPTSSHWLQWQFCWLLNYLRTELLLFNDWFREMRKVLYGLVFQNRPSFLLVCLVPLAVFDEIKFRSIDIDRMTKQNLR